MIYPNSSYDNAISFAISSNGFNNCFTVTLTNTPLGLRIRPLYEDAPITIVLESGHTLPSQGVLIESVGTTINVSRKVSVTKTNPFMPAIFDYILYQKSDTEPLSNSAQ